MFPVVDWNEVNADVLEVKLWIVRFIITLEAYHNNLASMFRRQDMKLLKAKLSHNVQWFSLKLT